MKYFSMFSGIAGFELAIGEKAECIGYSEIDKYAIQVYEEHFKHKNYGDATKIDTRQLPNFDLLVGGFPCQAFSIAGKRKGFDDTRGTLFFDIARILRDKRPKYLLLENVKGLLSHDEGKTFQTILGVLTDLGYFIEWQVLNSKNFGVPQNRERVFIVGHLRGEPRPKVFPIGEGDEVVKGKNKIANTLTSNYYKGAAANRPMIAEPPLILRGRPRYKDGKRGLKWYKYKDNCPTVSTNVAAGDQKNMVVQPVLTPDRPKKRQHGRRFKEDGEPSFTLTGQDIHGVAIGETLTYKGLCDKIGIYASPQETNAIKTLSVLQKKIGTKAFAQWGLGILNSLQKKKVLQPILYGKGIRYKANKGTSQVDDSSSSRKEDMPEGELCILWERKCKRRSSYQSRLARQFIKELTKGLSELPQQDSSIRIRRLTPLECERLQSFPDNFTKYGVNEKGEQVEISDSQRYKVLGNAVTVNVVREIMKKLL